MSTTAFITEPASSSVTVAAESVRQNRRKAPASQRLLCVSPQEDDHSALAQMLSGKGWCIDSAQTCRDAITLIDCRRGAIKAIICEQRLPDGTWRDLLHHIADPSLGTPLIVSSHIADADLWVEVLNIGGFDLLAKPFTEKEVLWVLESARQTTAAIANQKSHPSSVGMRCPAA